MIEIIVTHVVSAALGFGAAFVFGGLKARTIEIVPAPAPLPIAPVATAVEAKPKKPKKKKVEPPPPPPVVELPVIKRQSRSPRESWVHNDKVIGRRFKLVFYKAPRTRGYIVYAGDSGAKARDAHTAFALEAGNIVEFWDGDVRRGMREA